jgi:hypothetical protein
MLNPYWPCTQPLLKTIEAAKAAGAKDILMVSERSGVNRDRPASAGKFACVSYSGFASGLLHKALQQDQQFDLGIVELPPEDIAQFPKLVALATPHLRAGGMIIGFSLASSQSLSELDLQRPPGRCIVTGSAASARAIAAYGAALANRGGFRPLRLLLGLLQLAANIPRFWWVNRGEAAAARRERKWDAAFATSITLVASMPEAQRTELFNSEKNAIWQEAKCDASRYTPAVMGDS